MTRRHLIALAVALATMMIALVPPLWIRATGDEVALGLRPVDPLSLFRGNYVDLRYDLDVPLVESLPSDGAVYVVFDDARPANALRATPDRPKLTDSETCIRGRVDFSGVSFPELEQYFVTQQDALELERNLTDMLGIIRTTSSCRAVLVELVPIDG